MRMSTFAYCGRSRFRSAMLGTCRSRWLAE